MINIIPRSEEQKEMVRLAKGHAVVMNCDIEFAVRIEETEDGRARIFVDPNPPMADNEDCVALREMMEKTAIGWLKAVAPHRLSYGSDDR